MIYIERVSVTIDTLKTGTYVLVLDVFEELELTVGALAEDRGAEWLHDLLDRDGGACELVLGGTRRGS